MFVPSIALGELYYGAQNSKHQKTNLKRIDGFAGGNSILFTDANTAKHYGLIKSRLKKKGKPLPENDIWIAAVAMQHQLALVTRDGHFDEIQELNVEAW